MKPKFLQTTDGVQIAYDVCGSGPALMLLHGAGKNRSDWHKLGYVKRLQQDFTVVSVDLRGSGQSDFLANIDDYSIAKITADVHALADTCQFTQFAIWGYSFGGNIARYLGAWSDRVKAVAMIGVPFGPAVDAEFDRFIDEFVAKWGSMAEKYRDGNLDPKKRQTAIKGRIPAWVACFQAMRKWPSVTPAEMKCPTLLLVGSKNKSAWQWVSANQDALANTRVCVTGVDGLTHPQEFSQIEAVFPHVHTFLKNALAIP